MKELSHHRTIHLSGIAGSGMSGLAAILRSEGYRVVGTDPQADAVAERFRALDIPVHAEQDGRHIQADTQLIVASAALPDTHPELEAGRRQGIEVLRYSQMLGRIMESRMGIAVAGTHGKTTTSAMIARALQHLDAGAGFLIGGTLTGTGVSAAAGDSDIFVVEACEYNRSFLDLLPGIAVVTNLELDHLDVYENLQELEEAFAQFVELLPPTGTLIHSFDCPQTRSLAQRTDRPCVSYGLGAGADLRATDVRSDGDVMSFRVSRSGCHIAKLQMSCFGSHNVANALAAFGVCLELGFAPEAAALAVSGFDGVGRRFQVRGEREGVVLVDDYAHHPTEIAALLDAAHHRYPGRRIAVVFQPHQRSRLEAFFDGFAGSFAAADLVVITDVYSAREVAGPEDARLAAQLADRIAQTGLDARHISSWDGIAEHLERTLRTGDVLIVAGAGDINRLTDSIFTQ